MIANQQLQAIIEGALMASSEPLTIKRLMSLFEEDGDAPDTAAFSEALTAIGEACENRGFELKEVASGWRIQVREELAPWINRLWEEKPQKYSRASLETLALIAYRQPITRGDIEEIRGVAVSSHIIKTLLEREWVKVVGQRDVPGRPSLYATTRGFLDYFNLKSLDELPTLSEIRDLDELNAELDLGAALGAGASSATSPEEGETPESEGEASDDELADDNDVASDADSPVDSEAENVESEKSDFVSESETEQGAEQEPDERGDLAAEPATAAATDDELEPTPDVPPVNSAVEPDDNSESAETNFTDTQERDREV
ncbi:SMC-Scp complex subunit ScpB [uncultured Gilvimarinus sp.]|jgi:segregation and condensation protein B|uniref:SMC-Scp complex subunit ScpB n=1 Tax=uncultured Gilvimarinus sp. TaxID=1689143 RepID=UPI0030DD1B66